MNFFIFSRRILSKEDLHAIAAKIAEVEETTSGEIRVVLRHRRHWGERKLTLHELGVTEFHRLGMQNTTDRHGVLIMLLLSERKFQIIADEGIHKKVEDGTWDKIAETISTHFRAGGFLKGLLEAVEDVGEVLSAHFPAGEKGADQLPNDVIEE